MTPTFTWLPPNWIPHETKLYQIKVGENVADKKSEDAGHTKVPGKHHVTHADGNPPDELV
jgi:hypothetical protein